MLQLEDTWTWDFWIADTGKEYHIYFLRASKVFHSPDGRHDIVRNPDDRHIGTSVGHAVSTDLFNWTVCEDIMHPSPEGSPSSFDDMSHWTGSVLKGPDELWYMFYTGICKDEGGLIQRIGLKTSSDLYTWDSRPDFNVISADPRLYEKLGESTWPNETWRDPWVFPDPDGHGWHMYITARSKDGVVDDRGVVGHAVSNDLMDWEIQPALSSAGGGFGDLEVTQINVVNGRPVLLFSCLRREFSAVRKAAGEKGGGEGGVWAVPAESVVAQFDIMNAQLLTNHELYAGRLIQDRNSQWLLLAFANDDDDGNFVGHLADPYSVNWQQDGTLSIKPMVAP